MNRKFFRIDYSCLWLTMTLIVIVICCIIIFHSCGVSNSSIINNKGKDSVYNLDYSEIGQIINNKIRIDKEFDLQGCRCELPPGITLCFEGGFLKNGILVGNNTKILSDSIAFNHVAIEGDWNVPKISTRLFADLTYVNALKNVVALANPHINNHILIDNGLYNVSVSQNKESCLIIPSNTYVELIGTIELMPNAFESYNVILANGDNITLKGGGMVKGDKLSHIGTEGEWGMGINVKAAENVLIKDLSITDCWGDCIYIGGGSKNIVVDNCILKEGRRQGISITKADEITISNSKISNVYGTDPQYAIDIEPNKNCTVDHVIIENVEINDCIGGIAVSKGGGNFDIKKIGKVRISNCRVFSLKKYPIRVTNCDYAIVDNNTVNARNIQSASILLNSVTKAKVCNNIICAKKEYIEKLSKKRKLTNLENTYIKLNQVVQIDARNNIVKESSAYLDRKYE